MERRRNTKEKEGQKGRRNSGGKKERKKKKGIKEKSSAGFTLVRLVLLMALFVERDGVVGRIGFAFLLS